MNTEPAASQKSAFPTEAESKIFRTYCERTPRSAEAYAETERYVPGGNSRQAGYWAPYPLTITKGDGAYIWDLDSNRYLDLLNNYTALVHGHVYRPIVERVQAQVRVGTCWAANNSAHAELARQLVERVASIDQVRFTNSGTEAGALAMMTARILTGRWKILMARFGYHGALMEFEVGFAGNAGPFTYIARYGDLEGFKSILATHGNEIAAVFLEPVLGAGGVIVGEGEFVAGVCQAAHEAGALFVLDEVLTFRLGTGGRQESLGLQPDLTMFGKLIGGGFPVGAVGGRREILSMFDPARLKAFHSGTFNGNPVTMTAGATSVRELTRERIDEMERLALKLKSGLLEAANIAGLPLSINHIGSILNLYFTEQPVEAVQARPDTEVMTKFHLAAMNRGLFLASRGLIGLSTVMTDTVIGEAIERAAAAMRDVASEMDSRQQP